MKHTAAESYTESALPVHPAALLLPISPEDSPDDRALVASIRKHRCLLVPIKITHDGQLLDGRARVRACLKLGVKPKIETLSEDIDPYAYIVDANLARCHRTEAQKAMIALNMAKATGKTHAEAALACGVRKRAVDDVASVCKHAPELVQAIETGRIKSPWRACQLAKMTPDERKETELMFVSGAARQPFSDRKAAYSLDQYPTDEALAAFFARLGLIVPLPVAKVVRAKIAYIKRHG